jgi:hypothetical protein
MRYDTKAKNQSSLLERTDHFSCNPFNNSFISTFKQTKNVFEEKIVIKDLGNDKVEMTL